MRVRAAVALPIVVFSVFSTPAWAQAVDEAEAPGDPALWTDAAFWLAEEDEAATLEYPRHPWTPWWAPEPLPWLEPPGCGGGTLETKEALATAAEPSGETDLVCLDGGASLDGAAVVDGGGTAIPDGATFDAGVPEATVVDPLASPGTDAIAVDEPQNFALAEAPAGPLGEATPDALAYEQSLAEPLPAEVPSAEPVLVDAAVAATRSPSRGFNTAQLVEWGDVDRNRALDRMAETRSSVHRLTMFWWDVQPQRDAPPSQWNWAPYDRVIRAARSRGLRLILNPMGSPNWARPGREYPDNGTGDPFRKFGYPSNLDAWARFINELARRYNPEGFEIWNEQNSRRFWDPAPPGTATRPGPDPAKYRALFCRAAQAIRAVRPGETVGMGGLAPHFVTRSSGGSIQNMKASNFVRGAYAAGIARCNMTFVGYHPYVINSYCAPNNPDLSRTPGMRELALVRGVMRARSQGSRRIWNTEWGFPSQRFVTRRDAAGNPTRYCVYTETRQRNMIRREHLYLRRLGYMRFSIYFNIKDSWPSTQRPENNPFFTIGMLRQDANWTRKPSFFTWQALP